VNRRERALFIEKLEAAYANVIVPGREREVSETGWFIVTLVPALSGRSKV
jgi:hypothetical protein